MNIFVMVDMEGISGICRKSQVSGEGADYQQGRRLMTMDVNACVRGCLKGGATRVVVRDCHGAGFNVIWEDLEEGAEYLQGRISERMPGLDDMDGLILLGYHAMAGNAEGVLEHTMSSLAWQNFWINGEKAGEVAIDAAYAGERGVPVIMVSGDNHVCKEASALIKGLVTAEVKTGFSAEGAMLLPKREAHDLIEKRSAEAVRKCKKIKPYKVKTPVTLTLELVSRGIVPVNKPFFKVVDGRTYSVRAESMAKAMNLLF